MRWPRVLLVTAVSIATACANGLPERPEVVVVLKTLANPYWVVMRDSIQAAAERTGLNVSVQAPPQTVDVERQLEILEGAIVRRPAAILIAPNDSRALVVGVVRANEAGIPVIGIDTRFDPEEMARQGAKIAGFVGSDNFTGGRLAAEALLEAIDSSGTIGVLEGVPGQETARSRDEGFRSVIEAVAEVRVVASQPADWQREKGLNVFQNILTANPNLKGVFCANDEMALGAIQALRQGGYQPGQVAVVGFDAIDDALTAVQEGWMYATIAQQPGLMGVKALALAKGIIERTGVVADTVIATPLKAVKRGDVVHPVP